MGGHASPEERGSFLFGSHILRVILALHHNAVEVEAGASDDQSSFERTHLTTIFLVLGLFAGLYMIWLLFNLAVHALPVGAGISIAFWMRDHDHGHLAAMLGGLATGIAILLIGQFLFAVIRAPILRLVLALMFAIPAGIAGYHAVQGVMQLALDPGTLLSVLSWTGAIVIAFAAWSRLTGGRGSGTSFTDDDAGSERTIIGPRILVSDRIAGIDLHAGTGDGTP